VVFLPQTNGGASERFGCPEKIVASLLLQLGYSFNLDGSTDVHDSLASIAIAQAL